VRRLTERLGAQAREQANEAQLRAIIQQHYGGSLTPQQLAQVLQKLQIL
jgi:hypothetical protein